MPAPVLVAHDDKATRELAVAALIAAGLAAVGFHDPMVALDAVEDDSKAATHIPERLSAALDGLATRVSAAITFKGD